MPTGSPDPSQPAMKKQTHPRHWCWVQCAVKMKDIFFTKRKKYHQVVPHRQKAKGECLAVLRALQANFKLHWMIVAYKTSH